MGISQAAKHQPVDRIELHNIHFYQERTIAAEGLDAGSLRHDKACKLALRVCLHVTGEAEPTHVHHCSGSQQGIRDVKAVS